MKLTRHTALSGRSAFSVKDGAIYFLSNRGKTWAIGRRTIVSPWWAPFAALAMIAVEINAQQPTWNRIASGGFTAAAYGANTFAVLRQGSVWLSPDGETWTTHSPAGLRGSGIAYAPGMFVVSGGSGTERVFTSPDGVTWTPRTTGAISLNAVAAIQGRVVAVGAPNGSLNAVTSSDGITWTQTVVGSGSTVLDGIVASPVQRNFVAWSRVTAALWVSADGTTWSSVELPGTTSTTRIWGVTATGRGYLAAARLASNGAAKLYSSSDARNWSEVSTISQSGSMVGRGIAATERAMERAGTVIVSAHTPGISSGTLVVYGNTLVLSSSGSLETWQQHSLTASSVPSSTTTFAFYANGIFLVADDSLQAAFYRSVVGPVITSQPQETQSVARGERAEWKVTVAGADPGINYQWLRNGTPLPGATASTFAIERVAPTDAGSYSVVVTDALGRRTENVHSLLAVMASRNPARLLNLSILTTVTAEAPRFKMGAVLGGAGTMGRKSIVVRAVGPSLAPFGVADMLADPKFDIFAGSSAGAELVATNDNWGGDPALADAMNRVGAFALMSQTARDAAAAPNFAAGDYVVEVSGVGGTLGTVVAELYDATPAGTFTETTPRLVNVSVLKHIGGGLTVGFVIGGDGDRTVLVRAVGPGLAAFGVGGLLADPKLELFDGAAKSAASNDNWGGTPTLSAAFTGVGAFALEATSRDAALVATLQPGSYTVQVSGVGGTTGVALVEVYEVP